MTSSNTVSTAAAPDELPRPDVHSNQVRFVSGLPRPMSSMPEIADTGRISFGAAMRPPRGR